MVAMADLNNDECVVLPHDEVQFAESAGEVSSEWLQSFRFQKAGDILLNSVSQPLPF